MARYNFEKRTYSAAPDGIVELFIDARYMPISAQPYDGDNLCIEYYASEEYPYCARLENGIVILDCPQSSRAGGLGGMFGMFMSSLTGASWQDLTINVYVPRSYAGMLNLCTSCAKVSVHGVELRSRLHALTTNAAVELRSVIATAFELSTTNAKVYAENAAACGESDAEGLSHPVDCKIASTNGALDLRGFSTLGSLSCRTTNAAIKLHDVAVQGALSCATSNGALSLADVSVQDAARLKSSNASIHLSRLLARDMDAITSNGNIKGSVVGRAADFRLDLHTSNGKCSPAGSGAASGRCLKAHTSNANIALEFVD